jgi:DNA-binding NarL/FixJ family response regulator
MRKAPQRRGGLAATVRVAAARGGGDIDLARREIADFCKYLGSRINHTPPKPLPLPIPKHLNLSPRMKQTLEHLLHGYSEKQIARKLGLSPHTVHVYVKAIYRGFQVNSRGELLARFVQMPGHHPKG